ncbi:MAG: PKD domain-containing protein, partial [Chloroflexota bacterium]
AFAATPLAGSIPLTITFVNSSTFATDFLWDFGDGLTATETISEALVPPAFLTTTHLYTQAGVYTVSLTAAGPGGSQTLTQTNCLTVSKPALAGFSAFPVSGPAPLTVQFFDNSTGAASSTWDFGDGSTLQLTHELTGTLTSPSHTYSQAGIYSVTLLAANEVSTDTLVKPGYITVTATTTADFRAEPLHGKAPLSVTFTNSSVGADSYHWDFGDGESSMEVEPGHLYNQAGVYTVTLQASGPEGTETLVRPAYLTVTQPISVAFAAFPYSAQAPGLIQFLNNSSGAIERYEWDFGDGLTSTLPSPAHTYPAGGVYTVSLTASGPDDNQTLTKSNYITITSPILVNVTDTSGQAEAGLPLYAFNGTTYTGYSKTTDTAGVVTFTLPLGNYRFRADKNGTQFWSGTANHCPVPGCTTAAVTTSLPVVVSVADTSGQAEAGLPVYAFNGTTYTGYSRTTDSAGQATFTLPLGDYRFRADTFGGTQFWSGTANHCPVPGCVSAAVTTSIPVVVSVADTNGQAEAGLPVYAFNGSTYTGYSKTTDATGVVTFTLPLGDYRFRADTFGGTQFWSGTANHCPVPGCVSAAVTTSIPLVVSVADTNGQAEAGLPVYAFNGTTYTGYSRTTDAAGQAIFTLPLGDYRFRADTFGGTQFWSGTSNHCPVPGCVSAAVTTSIPVVVSVADTNGQAEAGLPVYAFNGTTYTGYSKTTNAAGQATFTLPLGDYRFRADKNGTQFWSGTANHCPVPGCTTAAVTTSLPVVVSVADTNGQAEAGLPVYAFNGTTYTGYSKTTNAAGVVTFTLPLGDYRFRVDKSGTQFWSGTANHCPVPGCTAVTVTLPGPAVPPLAGFSASPLSGTAPLTVTFTNSSTNATDYLWNFGDGASLTVANPTYRYDQAGVYTVTLTASGPGGSDVETKANYITVYEPVLADFAGEPLTGTVPLTVTFTNNSTGATGYLWDYGDGTTGTTTSLTHTHAYTQAGVYTVTLEATGLGGSDTLTRTAYISASPAVEPITGLSAANDSPTELGQATTLTATLTAGTEVSYNWDFGDGITRTIPSALIPQPLRSATPTRRWAITPPWSRPAMRPVWSRPPRL